MLEMDGDFCIFLADTIITSERIRILCLFRFEKVFSKSIFRNVFDPNPQTWVQVGKMGAPASFLTVVQLKDTHTALVCGGKTESSKKLANENGICSSKVSNNCSIFSATGARWQNVAPMNVSRSHHNMLNYNG